MPQGNPAGVTRFRLKLFATMMLVITAIAVSAVIIVERGAAAGVKGELKREFQSELSALHNLQELRQAALEERCRSLVRRPRIHAALEDGALDLLYPSAKDELRDVMNPLLDGTAAETGHGLHAEFYRFLDKQGAVIPSGNTGDVGIMRPDEEAQLKLPGVPEKMQLGYVLRHDAHGSEVLNEVIAMPIVSGDTGEPIAALVLGFKPSTDAGARLGSGIKRGVWTGGRLHLDGPAVEEPTALAAEVRASIESDGLRGDTVRPENAEAPYLFFHQRLNPDSDFPAADEVCFYPLMELRARQRALRWQVIGAGLLLLMVGYVTSHVAARKLSSPVERLAVDSAENFSQRQRAEAKLETTSEELQRAARFSADASHQLKTPLTVLRAGLEEYLAREPLSPEQCREISALVHQTYRLTSVIEDLLLLSRMEAGRLHIEFTPVDLTALIDAALDDLGAQPEAMHLNVETTYSPGLQVLGEKRYIALILQNLLENARKYNQPNGRIGVTVRQADDGIYLNVLNSGRPIPAEAQSHIFERFHRGAVGENVPGHGLGLNLARELAKLHGGHLRLVRSDDTGTEFEVFFRSPISRTVVGREVV